ncbi:MAG: glycosyltransferase [Candidatus Kapabacteria bacterium]|nr:glycosyltransferase [Ignavibacteriota bacterium]MCW5884634.1 glycosyltransferase [Candidatus Kapabacteria bacterium]
MNSEETINHHNKAELKQSYKSLENMEYDDNLSDKTHIYLIAKEYLIQENYSEALKNFYLIPEIILDNFEAAALYSNALFKEGFIYQSLQVLEILNNKEISCDERINKYKCMVKDFNEKSQVPLLTLCMIVKNESQNLPNCIESARHIVDEIIIIDTGSDDNTIETAKSFNCQVYNFQWNNDFSSARNESLKYAKGKWILYLDADEIIEISDIYRFRQFIINMSEDVGGINCIIESQVNKSRSDTEIQRGLYPRLFRNYAFPFVRFEGKVHEQVNYSLISLNKQIINSDILIKHYGYSGSDEMIESKIKRNMKLLQKQLDENPDDSYALFHLAQTYIKQQRLEDAETILLKALDKQNLSPSIEASAYNTLSQISGIKGDFINALKFAELSVEITENQKLGNLLLAESCFKLGDKIRAHTSIHKVLSLIQDKNFVPQIGFDIEFPESKLQNVLASLNKF